MEKSRQGEKKSYLPAMSTIQKREVRFAVSIVLFITSIAAASFISYTSQRGNQVLVIAHPLPAGVAITAGDFHIARASLPRIADGYISSPKSAIGMITERSMVAGEILTSTALSGNSSLRNKVNASIAVRVSDVPVKLEPGDFVSIFQLHDVRNGEAEIPPIEVAREIFISSISRKGNSFGSDLIVTVSITKNDLPYLLQATTSGRLALIGNHE